MLTARTPKHHPKTPTGHQTHPPKPTADNPIIRQAIVNTLLAKVHIKKKAGFKPTEKTTGGGAGAGAAGAAVPVQAAFLARLTSLTRRFNGAALPQLYDGTQQAATAGACVCVDGCWSDCDPLLTRAYLWVARRHAQSTRDSRRTQNNMQTTPKHNNNKTLHKPPKNAQPSPLPPPKTGAPKKPKREDDCIPDKLVMFVMLNICINTLVLGLRQVFVARTLTGWIALPCLWCDGAPRFVTAATSIFVAGGLPVCRSVCPFWV